MDKLLKLLKENARLSVEEMAVLCDRTPEKIAEQIDELTAKKILLGYRAVIDWEKAGSEKVTSIIEVKISPKRDFGFDEFAAAVARFPEVQRVYLMSGGYDIMLEILADSFRDVAMFVAKRLAPMDSVLSTATHFVLRTYKDNGVIMGDERTDERGFSL